MTNDVFGGSVAISGDTLVVGSCQEDSNSTIINAGSSDNSSELSGAAYVFVRSGETWTQQAYLKAANSGAGDRFGERRCHFWKHGGSWSPARSMGAWVASTRTEPIIAWNDSGAAYVFERVDGTWRQQAYLKASEPGF